MNQRDPFCRRCQGEGVIHDTFETCSQCKRCGGTGKEPADNAPNQDIGTKEMIDQLAKALAKALTDLENRCAFFANKAKDNRERAERAEEEIKRLQGQIAEIACAIDEPMATVPELLESIRELRADAEAGVELTAIRDACDDCMISKSDIPGAIRAMSADVDRLNSGRIVIPGTNLEDDCDTLMYKVDLRAMIDKAKED